MIPMIVDMLFIISDNKKLYTGESFSTVSNEVVRHSSLEKEDIGTNYLSSRWMIVMKK